MIAKTLKHLFQNSLCLVVSNSGFFDIFNDLPIIRNVIRNAFGWNWALIASDIPSTKAESGAQFWDE
jgi:hypothetical protein